LRGVQLTARVNRYILGIETGDPCAVHRAGLGALYGGQGAGGLTFETSLQSPPCFSMATVAGRTSIAVLSFLGFDGISTLRGE